MEFRFDSEKLMKLAQENKKKYAEGKPFPHMYFDDFIPEEVAEKVLEEFPKPGEHNWYKYKNPDEVKLASNDTEKFPPHIKKVLQEFNSPTFLKFLEELTGIKGLIPDPYYEGGGMHQTVKGGHLGIHADFNKQKDLDIDRRLNVLLYLNKDWKEEYGGHFELWNKEMTKCEVKVLPLFNRMAMFSTTDFSYHGHPDPLNCPDGESRKSLALYYYTNGRPQEEVSDDHSTLFKLRPGEKRGISMDWVVNKLVPPIVIDVLKSLKKRK